MIWVFHSSQPVLLFTSAENVPSLQGSGANMLGECGVSRRLSKQQDIVLSSKSSGSDRFTAGPPIEVETGRFVQSWLNLYRNHLFF